MDIHSNSKIPINESFKIEAGPGAGKTEFLANHIKNIIDNSDILGKTRKVACITYTNTAVNTILNRLGNNTFNKVEVTTIHSFLYKNIIKPYGEFIPKEYNLNYKKIDGHEDFFFNRKYINKWLHNTEEFHSLHHPNTIKQIETQNNLINSLKNWLLSMRCGYSDNVAYFTCDNKKANKDNNFGLNKYTIQILERHLIDLKKIYWKEGFLCHDDVLYFSDILINQYSFILNVLHAKFPYLLLDEFQDTNPIQANIVKKMKESGIIVGVIGDSAQAIYQFQGANKDLFTSFKVSKENIYTIRDNFRSSYKIVNFLNQIRTDIFQESRKKYDTDINVCFIIGNKQDAYDKAYKLSSEEIVVSLSRDNITSNAMKKNIYNHDITKNTLTNFQIIDPSERQKYICLHINAIELAINKKIKEAIKTIQYLYDYDKKKSLISLVKILNKYDLYKNGSLMDFYKIIKETLVPKKLSEFRKNSAPKQFYEDTEYKNLAICFNIIDDDSNHITIHKAKGAEYDNVIVLDNNNILKMLLNPDLRSEEHCILYVGMSRAKKRLFIQLDKLTQADENALKNKYKDIDIIRL